MTTHLRASKQLSWKTEIPSMAAQSYPRTRKSVKRAARGLSLAQPILELRLDRSLFAPIASERARDSEQGGDRDRTASAQTAADCVPVARPAGLWFFTIALLVGPIVNSIGSGSSSAAPSVPTL